MTTVNTPTRIPPPRSAPTPPPRAAGGPGNGAVRRSRRWYDQQGRMHRAAVDVPVDQYGRLAAREFSCRHCSRQEWFPLGVADKGIPACRGCGRQMRRLEIRSAGVLPVATWGRQLRPYLAPVVGLVAAAALGAGIGADGGGSPVAALATFVALAVALPGPVGYITYRVVRLRLVRQLAVNGHLDDPDRGNRRRARAARRARGFGYTAAAGGVWLAAAAGFGTDLGTVAGRVVWTLLPLLWLPSAATWWRWVRYTHRREEKPALTVVDDSTVAKVIRLWQQRVAVVKGDPVDPPTPHGRSA